MQTLKELTSTFAKNGKLEWIGVRPERRAGLMSLGSVTVTMSGLSGDHNNNGGKRSVTLVQAEHLPAVAAFSGLDEVNPQQLRRNLVISGINLLGLRNKPFQIGEVIFEGTGICAPCSRMEETLGRGGYSAVRGHGGITARVVSQGMLHLGDVLTPIPEENS